MKDLVIRAFQQHPMFEGISLANCATLMNCLGCIEKKYKKDPGVFSKIRLSYNLAIYFP